MSIIVDCRQVSKQFSRRGRQPVVALDDFSLQVESGEFLAIRGKSGCGKSTLMLCLGGLQRPDSGQVIIADQDIYKLPADRRARFRAQYIGYVFQQFHLIPYLSVWENVLTARLGLPPHARNTGDDDGQARAAQLIEQVGLTDRKEHKPAELSIGECQRVALARALMNRPQVILADEPTGNLDEENTASILSHLREIAGQGTAVVLVTHDPQCEAAVDRVIRLEPVAV